ncbi:integrase core domain-containing protein [Bradyrhizobium liaoningense]|uniref:integrase core domain-containing protein n=1 Tax=Bradyrhizobium liaoningense TaxID=43992 RepID=UPI001BA8C3CF|nr:transposase [Bradyrhizobium liaoningense]
MGIRDHPTAPRSPWQIGHVKRLIGSIRRECLDHIVVMGEASLRRTLKTYARYYNEVRSHAPCLADFTITTFGFRFSVHKEHRRLNSFSAPSMPTALSAPRVAAR